MRTNTNNSVNNDRASKINLAKKDYPSEVEEIWLQDRLHMTARTPGEANDNGMENWLETEAER